MPLDQSSSANIGLARSIALVATGNSSFSTDLVPDILHSDIKEGYRYTQVEPLGENRTRSVFSANGTFTYTILEGFGGATTAPDGSVKITSSGFGDEEISESAFRSIADAFARIDICHIKLDRFDFDHIANDQGFWSYEAIIGGRYCFAWFTTPPVSNPNGPAAAFDALFERAADK